MDFARHLYEGNQYALAFQEFRKHAADDPVAQHHMGLLYKQGNGVQRNFRRALTWFSRASGQGYSPSMVQLGHLFSREREFSTNYREAFKWYERAAKAGNAEGALALALMYWNGHGAEKDKIAGYAWLQIAADAGEAGAQRQLARVKAQMSESDLREAKILQRQVLEGGKSGSGAAEKH